MPGADSLEAHLSFAVRGVEERRGEERRVVEILKKCWPGRLTEWARPRGSVALPETGALITAEKTRD